MKKKKALIVILVGIFLLIGCANKSNLNENATNIIEDFLTGNYEYTISYYEIASDGSENMMYAYDGKLITEPYQQYEKLTESSPEETTIQEIYCYEKNKTIYANILFCDEMSDEKWVYERPYQKLNYLYLKSGLDYKYDHSEMNGRLKVDIFTAEYEIITFSTNESKKKDLPCKIKLEYYVDLESQKVTKLIADMEDFSKASHVANYMLEGLTREEAERKVKEEGFRSSKVVLVVKNFNGDVFIEVPK